jgi:hypothetical protein
MTKQTRTIETAYGETTIETYECDSCGTTVAYEETVEFTIGDTTGRACKHCEKAGPISFPRRTLEWALPKKQELREVYGLGFHVLLAPIVLPLTMVVGFVELVGGERETTFEEGFTVGVITLFVWVVLPLLLWVLLG